MKQAIDTRTLELPGLGPIETGNGGGRMADRLVHLYCGNCRHELQRARLPASISGAPACPACGWESMGILGEWVDQFPDVVIKPAHKVRGAYAGAVKLGCHGHALRARTGLSQAEFARRAGVSERSLRTWEAARDPAKEAPKCHAAIVAALAALGVAYAMPKARQVAYRHPLSGDTWSGRGVMPVWLRRTLEAGCYSLDELRAA